MNVCHPCAFYPTPQLSGEFHSGENIDTVVHKVGMHARKFFSSSYGVESSLEAIQHRFDIPKSQILNICLCNLPPTNQSVVSNKCTYILTIGITNFFMLLP
jgi:hypothetical protein